LGGEGESVGGKNKEWYFFRDLKKRKSTYNGAVGNGESGVTSSGDGVELKISFLLGKCYRGLREAPCMGPERMWEWSA